MSSFVRLSVLSFVVLLAGCTASQKVTYRTELRSAERSQRAQVQHGKYTIATEETPSGLQSVYEDGQMRAVWFFDNTSMRLTVENKSPYSIWIRLDKAGFALPNGRRDRVLRGDMSYTELNHPVPPFFVASSDPIIDERSPPATVHLLPKSNVEYRAYSSGTRGHGRIVEMIGPTEAGADSVAVSKNIGKQFSLTIPIETRDAIANYTFHFEVIGAKIPRKEQDDQVIGTYPTEDGKR